MITPNFESIPALPKQDRRWVLWKEETRKGKLTKPPYQMNGQHASVDDPATWTDFSTVRAAYEAGGYSGIGFMLSAADTIVGVDLDKCLNQETGELAAWASAIVAALPTYCEVSPSGRGLRLFGFGTLPPGGRKKGGFEMYEAGRYLTVTGKRFNGHADLQEITPQLAEVHARIFKPRPAPPVDAKPGPVDPLNLDDASLLDKARAARNGGEFAALWSGDTSQYGGDDSSADLALCNLLAFWTGNDPARIDRLFRQSGLMREKWDARRGDSTYGAMTITKALEAPRDTFRPSSKKTHSTPDTSQNHRYGRYSRYNSEFTNSNQQDTQKDSVTFDENEPVTTVTNHLIRPFFIMKFPDGTILTSANHDTVERLSVYKPGLWYVPVVEKRGSKGAISTPEHGTPVWISFPFSLLATTDDGRGHGHGLAIRFTALHGHEHTWTIPRAMLVVEGRELFQRLYELGFHMDVRDNAFHRLRDYLNRARSEVDNLPQALSVVRTGWAPGNRFVLPDHVFGGDSATVFYQSDDPKPTIYTVAGTVDEWRARVAMPIAPYNLPVFMVSCAFAGPLLDPLRIESGGFHSEGQTSTGKTSAQYWALSVWGEPRELVQTWEGTKVGFETVSAAYSDTLMVLDEIGRVDPRIVGTTVYQIMNGSGKMRGNTRLTHRATLRWRTLLLSSGEKSLAQIMAGAPGGVSPVAGQEVRLAHIPVDSDTGVFDGLTDGDARRALVRQINEAAAACYGHAGRAFLEQLTGPDGLGDATEATAEVKKIAAKLVGSSSTNEIDRVAIRFALVGFAGELATQYGITGWPAGRALAAAFALFSLWRKHWGSASRDETNFLQRLDEWLCEHRSSSFHELDSLDKNRLRDDRPIIRRPFFGYAQLNSNGTWIYYLNKAGWKNLIQPAGRGVAVNALERVKRLEAGARGDGGKLMRVGGEHGRFYVIHGERGDVEST